MSPVIDPTKYGWNRVRIVSEGFSYGCQVFIDDVHLTNVVGVSFSAGLIPGYEDRTLLTLTLDVGEVEIAGDATVVEVAA